MYDIHWKCPNLNVDITVPYRIYLPRNGQFRPLHSDSLWPWLKDKFLAKGLCPLKSPEVRSWELYGGQPRLSMVLTKKREQNLRFSKARFYRFIIHFFVTDPKEENHEQ